MLFAVRIYGKITQDDTHFLGQDIFVVTGSDSLSGKITLIGLSKHSTNVKYYIKIYRTEVCMWLSLTHSDFKNFVVTSLDLVSICPLSIEPCETLLSVKYCHHLRCN